MNKKPLPMPNHIAPLYAMSTLKYLAKPRSAKQKAQQELSWKLKMVMGARGTLYPREKSLPPIIQARLHLIYIELKKVEDELKEALAHL